MSTRKGRSGQKKGGKSHREAKKERKKEEPEPPSFKGFRAVKLLGEGTHGLVWQMMFAETQPFALKVIRQNLHDDGLHHELLSEASFLMHVRHPNIVPALDVFTRVTEGKEQQTYILMPFYPQNLYEWSKKIGFDENAVALRLRVAFQVWCALEYIHMRGFLHLDLKPDNILINDQNEAAITDFGMVHNYYGATYGRPPVTVGTPRYTAPELLCGRKEFTEAADWWAYGMLLYFIVFDKHLMTNKSVDKQREEIWEKFGWPRSFRRPMVDDEEEAEEGLDERDHRYTSKEREACLEMESAEPPSRSRFIENVMPDQKQRRMFEDLYGGSMSLIWGALWQLLQVEPAYRSTRGLRAIFRGYRCNKPRINMAAMRPLSFDAFPRNVRLLLEHIPLTIETRLLFYHLWAELLALDYIPSTPIATLAILDLASKHMKDVHVLPSFYDLRKAKSLKAPWKDLYLGSLASDIQRLQVDILQLLGFTVWRNFFFREEPLEHAVDPKFALLTDTVLHTASQMWAAIDRLGVFKVTGVEEIEPLVLEYALAEAARQWEEETNRLDLRLATSEAFNNLAKEMFAQQIRNVFAGEPTKAEMVFDTAGRIAGFFASHIRELAQVKEPQEGTPSTRLFSSSTPMRSLYNRNTRSRPNQPRSGKILHRRLPSKRTYK